MVELAWLRCIVNPGPGLISRRILFGVRPNGEARFARLSEQQGLPHPRYLNRRACLKLARCRRTRTLRAYTKAMRSSSEPLPARLRADLASGAAVVLVATDAPRSGMREHSPRDGSKPWIRPRRSVALVLDCAKDFSPSVHFANKPLRSTANRRDRALAHRLR